MSKHNMGYYIEVLGVIALKEHLEEALLFLQKNEKLSSNTLNRILNCVLVMPDISMQENHYYLLSNMKKLNHKEINKYLSDKEQV